jgi:hypothetical protein
MKRAQSIHGEINRTTEFNTFIGTPKGKDHLDGVNVDEKTVKLIFTACAKGVSWIEISNEKVS